MGIIADSFKATLEALIEADRESQKQTELLLNDIRKLQSDLEKMDLDN
jgi:hypothetical protein